MRKILLTGASGFIGSVVKSLLPPGEIVLAPSRAECDWLQPKQVTDYLEHHRPTDLLHLAWYAVHGLFWESSENLKWKEASLHLAQEFIRCGGTRLVAAGTCAEYTWGEQKFFHEKDETQPHSYYGKMKLQTFHELEKICSANDISMAWGRIFLLYGSGENKARILPKVILSLLQDHHIALSSGQQVRDYLHVQDVARAFVTLLNSPLQGAVNISSGKSRTLKEILNRIGEQLNRSHHLGFGEVASLPQDPPFLVGACDRLKSVGWSEQVDLDEGISQSIAWWKKQLQQGVQG